METDKQKEIIELADKLANMLDNAYQYEITPYVEGTLKSLQMSLDRVMK